jgi:hypothetical protein
MEVADVPFQPFGRSRAGSTLEKPRGREVCLCESVILPGDLASAVGQTSGQNVYPTKISHLP